MLSKKNGTVFIKGFLFNVGLIGIRPFCNVLPYLANDISPQSLINVETVRPKQLLWAASLYFGFPILCGIVSGYFVSTYIRGFQKKRCMNLITTYASFNK